jgi:hypothetical protein
MSEMTPGATAVMDATLTPETAASAMDALKADPKFMERVVAKDATAFGEYNRLWRVSHGLPAEAQPAINTDDVFKETHARAVRETETRADMLRADGLAEESVYQILNGRPIPLAERRIHEQELARLKRDQAWVQRYLAGDREARLQMRSHTAALTLPIARDLAEINAWERAHGRPLSQ